MAYTNSVESGASPLQAGTTFTRGLMWAGIAMIAFLLATAFDYRWLTTLAWPVYLLQLGLLVLTLASATVSAARRAGSRSGRSRSSSASWPRSS